jgi:hypothetical protein
LPIQAALAISGSLQGIAALKGSVVPFFGAESCFTLRLLAAGSSTSCFAALRSSLAETIGNRRTSEQETANRKGANCKPERRRTHRHKDGANNSSQNISSNRSKSLFRQC